MPCTFVPTMISIRRSEVPVLLHESEFFLSLNVDDDEEITIPENCCAAERTVTDANELRDLLSTLRFWGVSSIPIELCRVALDVQFTLFEEIAFEFASELSYLTLLQDIRDSEPEIRIPTAASAGNMDILRYLVETNHPLTSVACDLASRFGHLACLQYLHSVQCPRAETTASAAARYGQIDCLRFVFENGCPWHEISIAEDAAQSGIDCLRYVCEHGAHLHSTIYNVFAKNDDLVSLKYVFKHGIPWSDQFIEYAVYHNSLKCLQHALDNQCRFVDDALCNVKSVDCLQLIHNTNYAWSAYSSAMVAKSGNVDALRYLHELGCPWDENTCINAVKKKHTCKCLRFAIENGCVYTLRTVLTAVKCSHKDALTYIHSLGFVFPPELCAKAVDFYGPGLEMLTFLHSLVSPWDENTTFNAAIYGRVECLKYAFEHGCPVWNDICYETGMRGEYECLKFLHTRGCVLLPLQLNERNARCVQYVSQYRVGQTACVIH